MTMTEGVEEHFYGCFVLVSSKFHKNLKILTT